MTRHHDPNCIVYYRNGEISHVGLIRRETETEISVGSLRFKKTTCKEVGGTRTVKRATSEEISAAKQCIERKRQEAEEAEDARRKAAYDALPETIKLARKLCFACDTISDERLSAMPIDILRAAVEWIEAHFDENCKPL